MVAWVPARGKRASKVSGRAVLPLIVRVAGCDRYSCGHQVAAMPERTYEMDLAVGKEICQELQMPKSEGRPALQITRSLMRRHRQPKVRRQTTTLGRL